MTGPRPDRPDAGRSAGMAPERVPDQGGQTQVPPQATSPAPDETAGRPGQPGVPSQGGPAGGSGQGGTAQAGGAQGGTATATIPRSVETQAYQREPGAVGQALARQAWKAALVTALGMIAVGILLLAWPSATIAIAGILIGAGLIIAGLMRLYDGVSGRGDIGGGTRVADVVIGLLAVIAGLFCLKHHALTVVVLAVVVGVFWVIHGVGNLMVAANAGRGQGRGWLIAAGIAGIAAGLVILFFPAPSLVVLLTILGAWLLLYGLILGGLALGLRREARHMRQQPSPA